MPTAVLSDIHGNLEALQAVLADVDRRGISRIICLGDTVGYGPNPLECIDIIRAKCEWSLMGNHDFAVLYEPTNFNAPAEASAFWTRSQFEAEPDEKLRHERFEFLGQLRVRVLENGSRKILAVHGSPRRPINEYIFKDDVRDAPDKMESLFDKVEQIALVGHTHDPGVFTDEPDFYPPTELGDMTYAFSESEKAIINVGSVGQPRDMDPRASYAILHDDRIEFVRVAYDMAVTAGKIKGLSDLRASLGDRLDWLGDRLFEGR